MIFVTFVIMIRFFDTDFFPSFLLNHIFMVISSSPDTVSSSRSWSSSFISLALALNYECLLLFDH